MADYERVIKARKGIVSIDFAELWRYRELFLFLTWRDILVRYKQTYIGVTWAALQPLLTMVIFTAIFSLVGKFPSNGAPYPVLVFAALLPWQFFANAMTESSQSLVASERMITKVYFPRLIIPASAVMTGIVDLLISVLILIAMMWGFNVPFTPRLLMLLLFFVVAFIAAFSVGLWFSALNVRYRDVKYIVPFIVRMGMYISPVGFISDVVPERYRFLYNLNPMVGVIDGFRWCILGARFEPYWEGFLVSVVVIIILLITGAIYFRSMERTFADVI
ncbi:MAG TPA: ABC transporter permease [Verrucomicrobiota bacterium]|nr:ABC transporter permease [Verrucomicrobiota bacterium]